MSQVFPGGNNDSLWYQYAVPDSEEAKSLREWYKENYRDGFPKKKNISYTSTTLSYSSATRTHLIELLTNTNLGGIPTETKEARKTMSYDSERYDRNGYPKSNQQMIDEAVQERIDKPRREAEIAKRVALVSVLETLTDAPVGTVMTFERKSGKNTILYVALKDQDDRWLVTNDGRYSTAELIPYLSTGTYLAENLQVAATWSPLQAPASTDTASA